MNSEFKFQSLTIIVFCAYLFWGSFGIDVTLHPASERFPLHRIYLLLSVFIFLFNSQKIFAACLKNKLLIAIIIYILITAMWSGNPAETVKNFVFLSSVMFISIMVALAYGDIKINLIRWLFWLFLLMTLASIITALKFPHLGINIKDFGKPRWTGITSHPNALGAQALSLVWLSTNLFFLSKSKLEKLIAIVAVGAGLYAIINANSMTSLGTSIVTICYVSYCYVIGKLNLSFKLIIYAVAILGFLTIITFYMSTSELATTTLESSGRNATFTGRSLLWKTALKYVANNIVFGFGFDSLEQLTKKSHLLMSHLHNGYLETLVKGGIIASTLLFSIFIKTYVQQLKIKSYHPHDFIFLNSGFIMILLHNVTESSILRGLNPLSIFLIFIIVSTSTQSSEVMTDRYKNPLVP